MLEKIVVEKLWRQVLGKSVGGECLRRELSRSAGECCREKCWEDFFLRQVLERNVGEECCREALQREVL